MFFAWKPLSARAVTEIAFEDGVWTLSRSDLTGEGLLMMIVTATVGTLIGVARAIAWMLLVSACLAVELPLLGLATVAVAIHRFHR